MTSQVLADHLGGSPALGREIRSDLDLHDAITEGLPLATIESVVRAGTLHPSELDALVISRRTLVHLKRFRRTLNTRQSDRLTRIVRVVAGAEEAIGERDKARRWLRRPNRSLRGRRPLDFAASDTGIRVVERLLGRIEHGLGA